MRAGLAEFPKLAESSSEATEKAARTARNAVASSSARTPPRPPNAAQGGAAVPVPPVEVAADYVSQQGTAGGGTSNGEGGKRNGWELPKPGWARLQRDAGGVSSRQQSSEGVEMVDAAVLRNRYSAGEGTNGEASMPSPEAAPPELSGAAEGGIGRAQHANPEERAVLHDVFAVVRGGASVADKPEALYPAGMPYTLHMV